jgi:ElaB/YqjD/DUF883 family membrane-anchored ribosome-binding protein
MSILKACRSRTSGVCERAADSLESAADSIRSVGDQSATTISDLAEEAGEKLDLTATRVRKFGNGFNFNNVVTRHPVASVAVAAAAGLIAGFSCHRKPAVTSSHAA